MKCLVLGSRVFPFKPCKIRYFVCNLLTNGLPKLIDFKHALQITISEYCANNDFVKVMSIMNFKAEL